MNRFEKASIGLALVLIGALVLIHHNMPINVLSPEDVFQPACPSGFVISPDPEVFGVPAGDKAKYKCNPTNPGSD